ncbi:MAG: choice-of-anchor L domain-containing protein [Enhygromyxa sp.]
MQDRRLIFALSLFTLACADDSSVDGDSFTGGFESLEDTGETGDDNGEASEAEAEGDGDPGDGDPGDGDGDPGDGDGDPGDGDGDPGDGDGDPGDGDGDPGDGDGDPGDGDGDPGDGDGDPGDGDGDPGDGDGDPGDGDGDGDNNSCSLADNLVPCDHMDNDPMHAIGLNCPGGAPTGIPITNSSFNGVNNSWRVASQFGSSGDWAAQEGQKLLIITTGVLPTPNNNGAVVLGTGAAQDGTANNNPDNVGNLPAPISPVDGSGGVPFENCDGVNDCSDTLQGQWVLGNSAANDLLWFRFDLEVPQGANGFKFDFAFFSAEYPEWVDTQFNDVFLVWSTSETYTGNITFINDQPLTITALENAIVHEGNDPALAGTGVDGTTFPFFGQPIGGGTGWYTATASAAPSEDLTLAWAIFDMGDAIYDTTVVLDAFRWDCDGCIPSDENSCGIVPQ